MRSAVTFSFIIICGYCNGQQITPKTTVQDIYAYVEQMIPMDDEINLEDLYETLIAYQNRPINLNNTSRQELRTLVLLSEDQINNFIHYRAQYGPLISIYELQAVPDFDKNSIQRILPFVTVRSIDGDTTTPLLKRIFSEQNNYLLLRYERTLEDKKGFVVDDSIGFLGRPEKLYTRFRVSHPNDFSLGFTGEKDAGEPLLSSKKGNITDFNSFHFQLINKGKVKNALIGDYQLQFGQGLILASGLTFGKSAETIISTRRVTTGIRPYTSSVETGYFRGVATTMEIIRGVEATAFLSFTNQDAVLYGDTTPFIHSIQTSGLHRTLAERGKQGTVNQLTYGSSLVYRSNDSNLQAGLAFVTDEFSIPLKTNQQPNQRFNFEGKHNYNLSFMADYYWQNVTFFGELARSKSGGIGAATGAIISLTSNLATTLLYRNYSKNFHSFHGNGFSEASGSNQNEKGMYWELKFTPNRRYTLSAYFDSFSFPWLKSRISAPSKGHEYLFRASYHPKKSITLYAQYKKEYKWLDPPQDENDNPMKQPFPGEKNQYMFNLDYRLDKTISFRSRVQWSDYQWLHKTTGFAIIQDLNFDFTRLRINTRLALFDTDHYNRQYAYERDVLYAFAIPAYNGRGLRHYILLQYPVTRKIDVWLRFARTHYRDRSTIGSGYDIIDGNIKTDIKGQIRIKF